MKLLGHWIVCCRFLFDFFILACKCKWQQYIIKCEKTNKNFSSFRNLPGYVLYIRDIHPVFICMLQHVFICPWNLDLSVASSTSLPFFCTSTLTPAIVTSLTLRKLR